MTTEARQDRISSIIRACRLIGRMSKGNSESAESDLVYYRLLGEYYTRILNAKRDGKFLAAHTVFFPTEILYAMDIVPMHTEMTTWLTALFLGEQVEMLTKGAELGMAPEICSPHRGLAGAVAMGSLPKPDAIVWSNLICDNSAKSGEFLMKLTGAPGYLLDRPFQDSPGERRYFIDELNGMVKFLEGKSGNKMDWSKFSNSIKTMQHQVELLRLVNAMRRLSPSPFPVQGFLKLLTVDYLFPGQPEGTEYLEALLRDMQKLVLTGKGSANQEKFRLMTLFIPPLYLMSTLDNIFKERGAVSVCEPLFTTWSDIKLDPSRPMESVAMKSYDIPESRTMYGPLTEKALQEITGAAREYKVDGAVYWAFMGCRHTCATIKIVKDLLNDMDIPVLTIDCDIVDPTINSREEISEKFERFFELLEDR
ncbi:MAG TPA: 2-hydroxyacyl-CoA dehydratase family protein [Dehalococcoidales bacterium]|nr:2-hydroxyacyl-CoA dehydratase family protein [Dehalococcoidales bacterium]